MNRKEHTPAPTATETQASKFFCFRQNNSGGSFDVGETVAQYVIIEAHSAEDANRRAERVGIYFNGCDDGRDCSCCGDRWCEQYYDDSGSDTPLIYDEPPETFEATFTTVGEPMCHVYHLDGSKTTYKK